MNNFVISLKSSQSRRDHIVSEFSKHNVNFEFFDALFPSDHLNQQIDHYLPNLHNTDLTAGEKACFMSHYMALLKGANSELDYFTIFEDDVLLGVDSYAFLSNYDWIKPLNLGDDFIIKLEAFPKKIILSRPKHKALNREIATLKHSYVGAAGYIISKSAAKKTINKINNLQIFDLIPVDELLFNEFIVNKTLSVYQLNPALCIQERFHNVENSQLSSDLETDRAIRLNSNDNPKKKRNILTSIKKELTRFFNRVRQEKVRFK